MALFLECTQLCARSALRKYLTKPALLEMAGYVANSEVIEHCRRKAIHSGGPHAP
jgi:hypothetical protein